MCAEATTHQTPGPLRGSYYLTRAKGFITIVITIVTGNSSHPMCLRDIPYLLNNQHPSTEIQAAPPAYCQPTPPLVTSSMYIRTMCSLCTTAICIFSRDCLWENLIANSGTRHTTLRDITCATYHNSRLQ